MLSPEEIHSSLSTLGYVIIPDLIPSSLRAPLVEASHRVISTARDGSPSGWPHVRIVGKQFPPWPPHMRSDIWGIQHILHPDLNEPIFGEWYASPALLSTVQTILNCEESELQMELLGLLINPSTKAFSLAWHRDAIPPETEAAEELELLAAPRFGTQWNTTLVEDACLLVVPGSHKRVRTAEERRVSLEEPRGTMPGEVVVRLRKGETVFYDNNILHRAVYPVSPERLTLHGCVGTTRAGKERAKNILQHGLEWAKDAKYEGKLEEMRARLVNMAESIGERNLGYSLDG